VPDAPDPLGKRALFWAPAERHEAGPRRPEKRVLPGRHALFSAAGPLSQTEVAKRNGKTGAAAKGTGRRAAGPTGARSRPGKAPRAQAARPPRTRTPVTKVTAPLTAAESKGPISLSCSKCGRHTSVDVVRYMLLHLPWWLWRPGRGYTSLMRCPACGKRAWVSASWGPPED